MRNIRLGEGVFNKVVGNEREISTVDRFINLEKTIDSGPEVGPLLRSYEEMVTVNRYTIGEMALLEDLIILHRIRSNRDIQLSVQREYVYARQSCPRSDTRNQDIRICVARVEKHDVNNLHEDKELMGRADTIVCEYLDELIRNKQLEYNSFLQTKSKHNEKERSITI